MTDVNKIVNKILDMTIDRLRQQLIHLIAIGSFG